MPRRRRAALLALVAFPLAVVCLAALAISTFPIGLAVVGLLASAGVLAWHGLIRSGRSRASRWSLGVLALVAALVLLLGDGIEWVGLLGLGLLLGSVLLAKQAFRAAVALPPAPPPRRAVVVWNPKSGGGKAVACNLAAEARRRGIEPIELTPGDDLLTLVQDAVDRGADGLMAAGGDGTQALVAGIASRYDLPFACIPAGTRNHFALDLGVDRDDVVGALDAFVNGGEKRVDLGDVGGRTFVNNVSLGIYAEAVSSDAYRGAKIRTILATASTVLQGSGERGGRLRWQDPDGTKHTSAAVILVSNNPYRLGRVIGSGTRPRMNGGTLGIAVMGAVAESDDRRRAVLEWQAPVFAVESDADIALGVDGEAIVMPSPVTFRIRPGALRVRIAPQHPGASPAASLPSGLADGLRMLARIAAGSERAQPPAGAAG